MSELETLQQLIRNILGNDNKLRKESEGILNGVKDKNIDQYFLCLIELLKGELVTISNNLLILSYSLRRKTSKKFLCCYAQKTTFCFL